MGRENPIEYIHTHKSEFLRDDGTLRLGTYLALKYGDHKLAGEFAVNMKDPTTVDFLNVIQINLMQNAPEAAELYIARVLEALPPWAIRRTQDLAVEFAKRYPLRHLDVMKVEHLKTMAITAPAETCVQ